MTEEFSWPSRSVEGGAMQEVRLRTGYRCLTFDVAEAAGMAQRAEEMEAAVQIVD